MIDDSTSETMLLPYQELEKEVWLKNICAGCRGCITVCPTDALTYDAKLE